MLFFNGLKLNRSPTHDTGKGKMLLDRFSKYHGLRGANSYSKFDKEQSPNSDSHNTNSKKDITLRKNRRRSKRESVTNSIFEARLTQQGKYQTDSIGGDTLTSLNLNKSTKMISDLNRRLHELKRENRENHLSKSRSKSRRDNKNLTEQLQSMTQNLRKNSLSKSPLKRYSTPSKKVHHDNKLLSRMNTLDKQDDAEAYKKENRLLKNRLKSLLAIKQVQELNSQNTVSGMESELTELEDIHKQQSDQKSISILPKRNLSKNKRSSLDELREQLEFQEHNFSNLQQKYQILTDEYQNLKINKFLMGTEMLRLVKNNASMKRQMQGMEDTRSNLKLENKTLKENYEKLQKDLNKIRKSSSKNEVQNEEIQRLRKRISNLQQNLTSSSEREKDKEISQRGVKGLRDNAVFMATLLNEVYREIEVETKNMVRDGNQDSQSLKNLKIQLKDLVLHRGNIDLIKDCLVNNKGLLDAAGKEGMRAGHNKAVKVFYGLLKYIRKYGNKGNTRRSNGPEVPLKRGRKTEKTHINQNTEKTDESVLTNKIVDKKIALQKNAEKNPKVLYVGNTESKEMLHEKGIINHSANKSNNQKEDHAYSAHITSGKETKKVEMNKNLPVDSKGGNNIQRQQPENVNIVNSQSSKKSNSVNAQHSSIDYNYSSQIQEKILSHDSAEMGSGINPNPSEKPKNKKSEERSPPTVNMTNTPSIKTTSSNPRVNLLINNRSRQRGTTHTTTTQASEPQTTHHSEIPEMVESRRVNRHLKSIGSRNNLGNHKTSQPAGEASPSPVQIHSRFETDNQLPIILSKSEVSQQEPTLAPIYQSRSITSHQKGSSTPQSTSKFYKEDSHTQNCDPNIVYHKGPAPNEHYQSSSRLQSYQTRNLTPSGSPNQLQSLKTTPNSKVYYTGSVQMRPSATSFTYNTSGQTPQRQSSGKYLNSHTRIQFSPQGTKSPIKVSNSFNQPQEYFNTLDYSQKDSQIVYSKNISVRNSQKLESPPRKSNPIVSSPSKFTQHTQATPIRRKNRTKTKVQILTQTPQQMNQNTHKSRGNVNFNQLAHTPPQKMIGESTIQRLGQSEVTDPVLKRHDPEYAQSRHVIRQHATSAKSNSLIQGSQVAHLDLAASRSRSRNSGSRKKKASLLNPTAWKS